LGKESGSQELSRIATAYTASLAFGVTFLVALACGCELGSALLRASIVLGAAMLAGRLLSAPVVDVVLAAMARDEAKRRSEQQKHEAEP
jgi:hypothetical protein